jgi:hypothetical protein
LIFQPRRVVRTPTSGAKAAACPFADSLSARQSQKRKTVMKPQISKLFATASLATIMAALSIFQPFITREGRAAQGIYIAAATLEAQPNSYTGPCPTTIKFIGRITAKGKGAIKYTFTRSDGGVGPTFTLSFDGSVATQTVTNTWTLSPASYTGWQTLKAWASNEVESGRAHFKLNCQGAQRPEPPQPPRQQPKQQPEQRAHARFRVMINGFTVDHQTADDILERDGRGDEVFFLAQARLTEGGRSLRDSGLLRSRVMGDANGRSDRINAGSSPPNLIAPTTGGLRASDAFPSLTPWRLAAAPTADRAPMLLFDGDLASGQALTIAPTIWEWDGPDDLLTVVGRIFNPVLDFSARATMPRPRPTGLLRDILGVAPGGVGSEARVGRGIFGDPHDRPVGMQFTADGYTFLPQRLLMSYELADAASRADFGFGAGVIPIRYADNRDLQGDYRIFVQVQRLT